MSLRLPSALDPVHGRRRDRILTGVAIVMVVHLFVLSPLEAKSPVPLWPVGACFVLLIALGLLALARSLAPSLMTVMFLGLTGVAVALQAQGLDGPLVLVVKASAWLLISTATIWVVAGAVYAPGPITYHRVVGAALLYVMIGLLFMALYGLIVAATPDAFRGSSLTWATWLPNELVYFSFVTLTTVGYGDIIPVDPLLRGVCNLEAIVGQLFPATLLARLVSLEVPPGTAAGE